MNPTRTLLVTLTAGGLLVGAAATAGLITAGGASAAGATAAVSAPTPSPSTGERPDPLERLGGPGRHGGPRGLGGLRGLGGGGPVLHGEFVTGGPNGTTRTVVVQNGTVSAKAGSKITVTSSDGYKAEWVLNDSTRVRTGWSQGAVKDIAKGDTVLVQGTKTGATRTPHLVAERPKGAATAPRRGGPAAPSGGTASPSGA
jgi:hypothetical protein